MDRCQHKAGREALLSIQLCWQYDRSKDRLQAALHYLQKELAAHKKRNKSLRTTRNRKKELRSLIEIHQQADQFTCTKWKSSSSSSRTQSTTAMKISSMNQLAVENQGFDSYAKHGNPLTHREHNRQLQRK